jgi:hypothetical protein
MTYFTGILAVIAEVADESAAELIAREKGGLEKVYIPKPEYLKAGHWLVDLVGMKRAVVIAEHLGGGSVEIGLGETAKRAKRAKVIDDGLNSGKSSSEIARIAGCHQRTIRRHRNPGSSGNQGDLF